MEKCELVRGSERREGRRILKNPEEVNERGFIINLLW